MALRSGLAAWPRTLKMGFWLGWQIESNWTEPFLFFVYSVARPLGGALILVFMYFVVAQAKTGPGLWFLVVGSAFWPFVLSGVQGMAWAVISDREHWRTMRYIYTAPIPYQAYLTGRALAQIIASSAAMAMTLAMGWAFLDLPLDLTAIDWPYWLAAMVLGFLSIVAVGLLLVTVAMSVSGDAWRMPEGVGAALYLICGVIFPIAVLPAPLEAVARLSPLTWWLEAVRRGVGSPGTELEFAL